MQGFTGWSVLTIETIIERMRKYKWIFKNIRYLLRAMVLMFCLTFILAGCSSDDGVAVEEYDTEYQIKFYNRPPYADYEQGRWYKDDSKEVFFKLKPNTYAPYDLLVCPKNERGEQALQHIAEQRKDIILDVLMTDKDPVNHYFVTSTMYFESPDLYVSDNYFSTEIGMREGDYCRICPMIIVNLKEGTDIRNIEQKYKDVMTLRKTNDREETRWTTYYFACNVKNSYEALRLAEELYKRDDVNWAETDMYSPIYFD